MSSVVSGPAGIFGCRVVRIATRSAAGWSDDALYLVDFSLRHAEMVAALLQSSEEGIVYDLRLVAASTPAAPRDPEVEIYLLGRKPNAKPADRRRLALSLGTLVHATFPELDVEVIGGAELAAACRPFEALAFVGLRRRSVLAQLDTLGSDSALPVRRPLGFAQRSARQPDPLPGSAPVYHLCPFVPRWRGHATALDVLRGESTQITISVRMAATTLTHEEAAFLERQVGVCERYAQVSLGQIPDQLETLFPTLREQARQHQEHQASCLFGLRARAALVTVEIASHAPLSSLALAAIGGLYSAPPGTARTGSSSAFRNLEGGFELFPLPADARRRFESLEIATVAPPVAPPAAARLAYLFEPRDAISAFRFPAASDGAPAGLDSRAWSLEPAPPGMARHGVLLGRSLGRAHGGRDVRLAAEDRLRHLYCVGQTGTGKSSLLRSMLLSDIDAGEGVCLVDPHGDLFHEIVASIPRRRRRDVVILDPLDSDWPVGLNLLEHDGEEQRHFLVQELLGIMDRLLADEFGAATAGHFAGPVFHQHVRMNLLLAMSRPNEPGTLLEFHSIFQSEAYWRRWLPLATDDPQLQFWVDNVLSRLDYTKPGSDGASLGAYVSSKFDRFVFDPKLRLIFAQKRSTIRLDEIMDGGKILLVNLAKGLLTEDSARFLGMVLLAKLEATIMARARRPRSERRPFYLYVDEFQSLATSTFVGLLSEARKFRVGMVLANQFLTQLEDRRITNAILGNAGTLVCFRLGAPDAEAMAPRLAPVFDASDLQNLPNFHACVAALADGEAARPFTMTTLYQPAPGRDGAAVRQEVVERSRARYGTSRRVVEAQIAASLRGGLL